MHKDHSDLPSNESPRGNSNVPSRRIPIIIDRSPIEFVLVGPRGKETSILARSKEAKIDLIGFSVSDRERLRASSADRFVASAFYSFKSFFLFFGRNEIRIREMNAATSLPQESESPEVDPRKQRYRFCWIGECTSKEAELIQKVFDRQMPDIRRSINKISKDSAELALSPIIFECSVANSFSIGKSLPFNFVIRIYILALILTTIAYIISLIFRAGFRFWF